MHQSYWVAWIEKHVHGWLDGDGMYGWPQFQWLPYTVDMEYNPNTGA